MYDYLDELKQAEEPVRQAVDKTEEVLGELNAAESRSPGCERQPWEPSLWERWFRRRRARLKQAEGRALRGFLEGFRPLVLILYAAILVRLDPADDRGKKAKEGTQRKVAGIAESERSSAQVSYEPGCYYSRVGEAQNQEDKRRASYRQALFQLENVFENDGEYYAKAAREDPSLRGVRENEHTQHDLRKLIEKYGGITDDDLAEKPPSRGSLGKVVAEELASIGSFGRLIGRYITILRRGHAD